MNLVLDSAETANKKCGCYVKPEQVKLPQNQSIFMLVPLISSEYDVEIANTVANISLTQVYQNPTDRFLELYYNFPISPNACIYRFVATFGNTKIQGIVKDKEQAINEYEKAINQGKQAAYGDINANSKDILNIKIGNISPKQSVKIQIVYMQELTLSYNMFYQFHIMGTISPRYINHIPQNQVRQAYRNEQARLKGQFYWNFTIRLTTTRKVIFADSHSHKIQLVAQNDAKTQSQFQMAKQCIPNQDFIFTYTTQDYQLPSYLLGRTDLSSTAMLSFIPKFCTLSIDDAYKESIKETRNEIDIDNAKGQYIFLLDRSGSMDGSRIQKAKQALILFIKSLPSDTYFNIVSFGSNSQSLFGESVKYNDKDVHKAINQVSTMAADMGGTQIQYPLQKILRGKLIQGYPKQIFLLTDGAVSNTEGVIKMVHQNNKYSRVHTIGIGNGCSEQLILGCAKKGKGYYVFINDSQDSSQKIIQLLTESLSPVISSMQLTYDSSIVQSIIPNPSSLPYILKGELVNFFITFKGQIDKSTKMSFSYIDSQNKLPYTSDIQIDPESTNHSFIDKMGHFKKIKILEQSYTNNKNIEDHMFYVKVVDKKAEIIKQSVAHQILSEFTAFLCIEQQLINGKYQEVKNIGQQKFIVQCPIPIRQQGQMYPQYQQLCCNEQKICYFQQQQLQSEQAQYQVQRCVELAQNVGEIYQCDDFMKCDEQKYGYIQQPMQIQKFQMKQMLQGPEDIQQKNNQDVPFQIISTIKIDELISYQTSQGSWKDLTLLKLLFDQNLQLKVASSEQKYTILTYIIAKWIQKNYPQKKYSLVIKKAINYAKKSSTYDKIVEQYENIQ